MSCISWFNKFLILSLNMASIFFSLNSSSFFMIWFFMEINLLTFVSFLNFNFCKFQSLASVKYFCIQALASSAILFIFLFSIFSSLLGIKFLMFLIISIKLGAAPFHSWFISVILKVNTWSLFWLSSFQKVIPLLLMNYFLSGLSLFMIGLSAISCSISAITQISLKKLLGYSSVFSLVWLLSSLFFSYSFWLKFLIIYSAIASIILVNSLNLLSMFNKKMFSFTNFTERNIITCLFIALMGFPPFAMFFVKLFVIKNLILTNLFLCFILILSSIWMMFMYMSMILKFFIGSKVFFIFTLPNFKSNLLVYIIMILTFLSVWVYTSYEEFWFLKT